MARCDGVLREGARGGAAVDKARDYLLAARNPGLGWRYGYRSGQNDTSVTFWASSALAAVARSGRPVDAAAFEGALAWVLKVTDPEWGRTGYTEPGNGPARRSGMEKRFPCEHSEALTAAGLLIRHYAGDESGARDATQQALLAKLPPRGDLPDMYYWHLGARAWMASTGSVPKKWFGALVAAAAAHRDADGSIRPRGPWGEAGGRIMSTAFTACALAAPFAEQRGTTGSPASGFLTRRKRTVEVPASSTSLSTGIYYEPGMELHATPSGRVRSYPGADPVGPEGHSTTPRDRVRVTRAGRCGCLLGRIGTTGKLVVIRKKGRLRFTERGPLNLLVNDEDPYEGTGEFAVLLKLR